MPYLISQKLTVDYTERGKGQTDDDDYQYAGECYRLTLAELHTNEHPYECGLAQHNMGLLYQRMAQHWRGGESTSVMCEWHVAHSARPQRVLANNFSNDDLITNVR